MYSMKGIEGHNINGSLLLIVIIMAGRQTNAQSSQQTKQTRKNITRHLRGKDHL